MKRPLAKKRPIGPFAQIRDRSESCKIKLHLPGKDFSEELENVYRDFYNESTNATHIGSETIVTFGNEVHISTIYFGITDVIGEVPTDTYISSTSDELILRLDDSIQDIQGSISLLSDFLGELEKQAEERDEDIETGSSSAPSNSEVKEAVNQTLDEIADGISSIKSYRVYWDDGEYTVEYKWKDNRMELPLAIEVIAGIAEIPEEHFGGPGRDLQSPNGKAACYSFKP